MPHGYYNQPLLKPPVWTWEIPVYFFVGGVAGIAAVLAAAGALTDADAALVRDARWIAVIGALLSPALLISDLGRPGRFLNMLRVFKTQSPMSVGAWTLVVFTPAVLAALIWDPASPGASAGARVVGLLGTAIGAATGLVLATYTGVLLGVTAIPVWAAHARTLPWNFAASSLGAAVSILELAGHRDPAMNLLGIGSAATLAVMWVLDEIDQRPASRPLTSGPSGRLIRAGKLLAGPVPLVLRIVWPGDAPLRLVAAASAIAGALLSRFAWMVVARASVLLAALMLLVTPELAAQQPRVPDLSTKTLVATTARYVEKYQEEFKFLLADETYVQTVSTPGGQITQERVMKGELFLTYLAGEADWIAVHDFTEVDGVPVPNREDVRALLQKSDVRGVGGRIANRNAQYNIGRLGRNFNQPTLPLLLFGPKRIKGVAFERREVVDVRDRTIVSLGFTERERPTLVRSAKGAFLYSRGTVTIDAGTGRVERSEIEIKSDNVLSRLTTEYAPDEKLKLWVPTLFRELYESSSGGERELIRCEARYTNYRRFEVTGRIKK
jgi:formate-dependent nitrite reductase membrane component NrfD